MTNNLIEINPKDVKQRKPFIGLFPMNDNVKNAIKEDMEDNRFDQSKPIDVWNGICIDGHTRLQAAIEAKINVWIFEHNEIKTEEQALEYAIHNQRDRRNLTDADIIRCVEVLDKRKKSGERTDLKNLTPTEVRLTDVVSGPTSEHTAKIIGTSPGKVEKVRTVLDYGDNETKEAVKSGEMSINKAYNEIQEKRGQETKKTFNQVNENIEWAKWSWNPITGCKHGCEYCYARDIANRFYPQGFKPTFYQDRLEMPKNTVIPRGRIDEEGIKNVFLVSMGDMFGEWVPQKWIDDIFDVVKQNPQWNFLVLTKNPKRLVGMEFSDNIWIGTTVDVQARVENAEKYFREIKAKVRFVSCEPLKENLKFDDMSMFDWVIIGGQSETTSMSGFQPPWEWVESLINQARKSKCKIYIKPNLKSRPKEYP